MECRKLKRKKNKRLNFILFCKKHTHTALIYCITLWWFVSGETGHFNQLKVSRRFIACYQSQNRKSQHVSTLSMRDKVTNTNSLCLLGMIDFRLFFINDNIICILIKSDSSKLLPMNKKKERSDSNAKQKKEHERNGKDIPGRCSNLHNFIVWVSFCILQQCAKFKYTNIKKTQTRTGDLMIVKIICV